ncbi:crispR-associated [Caudoviricetes sp.]|nr:crispR-associated [Caudoviricetes sp.]
MRRKSQVYPQHKIRASSAGNPCKRFHWYSIKNWNDRPVPDETLQSIFEEGKFHETKVIQDLQAMGFEIVETQRALKLENPDITGSIDGILRWEGKDFPFDIKTTSPHVYDKISCVEDLLYSKSFYHRNYVTQLQLYLLMTGNPIGLFIMKNKVTGRIKPIWMEWDPIYCDEVLKRATDVYAAITADKLPEPIGDVDLCMKCDFRHVCLPDLAMANQVTVIDDQELGAMLDRRNQLEESAKEFKEIDEEIKSKVQSAGAGERVCGNYMLQTKNVTRKGYQVKDSEFLQTKIVPMKVG